MKERRSEAIWNETRQMWRIDVQHNNARKSFYSSVKGRKGKHEAEAKADAWLELGTKDMRFDAAWAGFLDYIHASRSEACWVKHESIGRLHILPLLGTKKLSVITPVMWHRCIIDAANSGLSRKTCENIRGSITLFCNYATLSRYTLQIPPKNALTIPSCATPAKEKSVLQPAQLRTLFADDAIIKYGKSSSSWYIHAWRFEVLTGLRRGELCGIRVEDIADNVLHLKRSINNLGETTNGKNDNARRRIVLPPIAMRVLSEQREMLNANGIKSAWVFPDENGECTNPNAYYKAWYTYRNQHHFTASLHELRHTFISVNKYTMPIEMLKSVVGHSVRMDTIGVYGHKLSGEDEAASMFIEKAFEDVLNGE